MSAEHDFTYVGGELGLFAHATNWKRYWSESIRPFFRGSVLEVGAGIGTNTVLLRNFTQGEWLCLEPDRKLVDELKVTLDRHRMTSSCRVQEGTIAELAPAEKFDTIIYIDVLEHIPEDGAELTRAATRLRPGGKVVVLSPAHQWLYSEFDRSIGHCRRYSRRTLLAATPPSLRVVKCFYLDSCGLFASLANRMLLRQSMPTLKQIQLWDKRMVPVSRLTDPITCYKAGKSIIGVWEPAA